ncbi:hypothetical protein [Cupriavidus alkaliphilus]|uniref:hypothetical protein n=1 Tax=Cupriavidus alkaliphilus TaxID=942866 RepID=UPI001610C95F|nr:hypothetical protein [Cupriavidus alkaliphilus]MBB2918111.1 hypothetical protein [Cupriavidus alkaliphilus]
MLQENEGKRFWPGWPDGATHYVKEGALVERPVNTARLDGMTLRDLPVPCVIVIDGARYDCDEPLAELDLSGPGMYAVTVEAFPALDASFVVEVSA